jgi:hypothetical protein
MAAELRFYDSHKSSSITLPSLRLPPIDHALDAEIQTERVVIRAGRDAWQSINRTSSFENWRSVGAALAIGRAYALRVTGANRAWGRNYSRVFCDWMKEHKFDTMPKSVRSVAIELHEHIGEITSWRNTLTDKERRSLNHPLSVVRRWRAVTAHGPGKCPEDLKRDAVAAWRRFIACIEALPQDQAEPLLQTARLELCR